MKNSTLLYKKILLIFALLNVGVTIVWGRTSSVNTAALWSSSTYSDGDSVVWSASNVTFKLHNGGDGDIELYLSDHILIQKNRTYTLEWRVAEGYIINVTQVSVKARGTLQSYITVGTNKSGNIYGQSYTNVNSQVLSLGNSGTVDIYPESDRDDAIIHMEEITVTYTMDGVEKEVTFDGTKDWGNDGTEKFGPAAFEIDSPYVTFSLKSPVMQYNTGSGKKNHEYFYLGKDNTAYLQWSISSGYTINVKSIEFNAKNTRATIFSDYGKGYVHTSRMSQSDRKKVCQSGSWSTKTFAVSDGDADNLFGNPATPLTNNEYFVLSATTHEWQIKTIDLTYTIAPKTYTITLDSEGGSDGSENVTMTYDSNLHEAITNPTKEGCTFEGWYTEDNGIGALIIDADGNLQANVDGYTGAGGIWKKDADDVTLYAKWSGVPYSVRFNGNGSTGGSMSNQDFEYGTAQELTANGFEKTCMVTYDANGGSCGIASSETPFSFLGWATSAGGDVEYADEEEVENLTSTSGAVFDLYAKWSASPNAVELPTPTKENSVFTGWYNADEDSIGNAGYSYTPSGNETLKAHWKPGASSENNNDDVSDGKIVINGPHATFTIAGPTDIYYYTGGSCGDDGYFLASIDPNDSKSYTLSWTCDAGCTIEVTKISFWGKAYNWAAGRASKAKMIFNSTTKNVGTAALTCSSGDYAKFEESGSFTSPMTLECQNNHDGGGIAPHDFDFYIKNIEIEYTITPNAPTASETDLVATLNLEDKQTVDVSTLFSMTDSASDFTYSYRLKEAYTNAALEGNNFYATVGGDYEVQACVASAEDHEASAWSTATIHVTRTCVFHNTTGDMSWQTTGNWAYSATPTAGDAVRVQGNLTVDEQIEMLSLSIEGAAVVEVAPTGGLTVGEGGISGATSDNLKLTAGTTGATKGQTGYLRISPEYTGAMPEATVELFSIGYYNKAERETQKAAWQFVGAPIADEGVAAKSVYTKSWIYSWDESSNTWVNNRATLTFSPFVGYETTQYKDASGLKLVYSGTLVSGVDTYIVDLTDSLDGYNALANSFAAPIDISQFTASDFINAEPTISVLNTGTQEQSDNPEDGVNAPGKYLSIPVATATELASEFGYPLVIPSMQGFFVQANSDDAKIKLDYDRLVWNADYSGLRENKPLRAPTNTKDGQEELGALKVTIIANGWTDHTYILESENYAAWYERGYDARKIMSEDMDIYTISGEEKLSVNATNSIIGTHIGVRTGEETAYTLIFTNLRTENELALYDEETDAIIDINNDTEYTFFAEPETEISDRFCIVARGDAPAIATDVDQVSCAMKAHKFIKDSQLFILKNGVLYNATGTIVR